MRNLYCRLSLGEVRIWVWLRKWKIALTRYDLSSEHDFFLFRPQSEEGGVPFGGGWRSRTGW